MKKLSSNNWALKKNNKTFWKKKQKSRNQNFYINKEKSNLPKNKVTQNQLSELVCDCTLFCFFLWRVCCCFWSEIEQNRLWPAASEKISFIIIVVALEVLTPCKKHRVRKMRFFVNKISSPRNYTKWEWAYFCGIRVLIGDPCREQRFSNCSPNFLHFILNIAFFLLQIILIFSHLIYKILDAWIRDMNFPEKIISNLLQQ